MKKILTLTLLIFLFTNLYADFIQNFRFDQKHISYLKSDDYDQVFYGKLDVTSDPGLPQLPFKLYHSTEGNIVDFKILDVEYQKIAEDIILFPVQNPQILSLQDVEFQPPILLKPTAATYPEEPVDLLHTGKIGNKSISSYRIFPLKYHQRSLYLITGLKVKFFTITSNNTPGKLDLYPTQNQIIGKLTKTPVPKFTQLTGDINKYIIITSEDLANSFKPLQEWKNKKGLSAKIITTEWIDNQYSGVDLQEKIRNCIKDYHKTRLTSWVLLGGDTEIIPDRKAWAFDCEAGYAEGENEIPCDLYYADLDGSWNDDGDDLYGEIDDNIDLYSDIFVGRAPVENITETDAFVNKLLAYEKAIVKDYQTNMMFLSQILWHEPYTNSAESKDLIDDLYVPKQFDPILKLYEYTGSASKSNAVDAINNGANIINHTGHAWYNGMSLGGGSLGYTDMMNLNNPFNYGFIYSIGCWPAAFDKHAVAEDYITNPNGGGIAFVGNSRYGWGSPGNPLFGYSDRYDQQFFKKLFIDDIFNIGATLAATKAHYAPLSAEENVYRWCQYELNLLGDPEMPIFTNTPRKLFVNFPDKISDGNQEFRILVTDSISPVANSTVCLMQENGTYFTQQTGQDGIAKFKGLISSNSNELQITVTAHNFIPFEDNIDIVSQEAFISVSKAGHDAFFSSIPNSGKVLYLTPHVKNTGSKKAENLYLLFSSLNPKISMIDSILDISVLNAQDSMTIENTISFYFSDTIYDNEKFLICTDVTDHKGHHWQDIFSLSSHLPYLQISDIKLDRERLHSGDSFQSQIIIKNTGSKFCEPYSIEFEPNENIIISSFTFESDGLKPSESDTTVIDFQIVEGIDNLNYLETDLSFNTISGYKMNETIGFNLGEYGFADDFETEADHWIFNSPETNQWTRSEYRKVSGNYSFYCGNDENHIYHFNNTRNIVETDYFLPGKDPKLSFYCWYKFPNYGISGMLVEILHDSEWKQVDFIGSGGALGLLPTGNDWTKYEYDLSFLPEMVKTKLRLTVTLDPGELPTEGVYIDDLKIENQLVTFTKIDNEFDLPANYHLYQNYPNPFNPATTIMFTIPKSSNITINIYDLQGRHIEELTDNHYTAGTHEIHWNASKFSSGIYFYKINAENFSKVKKCLYIK